MKQQIIIIHGGESYKSYSDYLHDLKSKEIKIDRIRANLDWKATLHNDLNNNFDVLTPNFPNKQNAQYEEWKILFNKVLDITDKDLILVGHSLGGMFLIKYLSENKVDKNIKALILVAVPYKKVDKNDKTPRFAHFGELDKIPVNTNNIYFIHSKDDTVVGFDNLEKFRKDLPHANYLIFEDRNHFFKSNSLPEILDLIESVNGHVKK